MRSFISSAALLALIASPAVGADLPVRPAAATVVASWTGFYIGGNFGLSIERNQTNMRTFNNVGTQSSFENFSASPTGVAGGVQAGYNLQVSPRFVLGVEADIQLSSQKEDACIGSCTANSHHLISHKLPWFATVRGRAGYSTGPAIFYLTGGWVTAKFETNALFSAPPTGADVAGSVSATKNGWTAGGGLEAQLFGNWTGKIEY